MSEEEAKNWVKDRANQQAVVDRFFEDYQPAKVKLAYYMAGIPGAGKTEFAENVINETKPMLAPVEHDKLVEYIEGYKPEDYYSYRKAGSVLVTRILDECLKRGYGFIFDGTLSHGGGYRNIEKTLRHGYYVQIVYIVQDINLAWQLTQDRELVKKRSIDKTGFRDTCNKINKNLLSIFERFKTCSGFGFWIFDKNGNPGRTDVSSVLYTTGSDRNLQMPKFGDADEIEKALVKAYNMEALE